MRSWLNGEIVDRAVIDVLDRGFLLADGAFETIYVDKGRAALLQRHMQRLKRGLDVLRIAAPPALDDVSDILAALLRGDAAAQPWALRISVSRGSGRRGLAFPDDSRPTVLATLSAPPPRASELRVVVAKHRRYSAASTNGFKFLGGYAENMLALDDARRAGADDALLLNEHGRLSCASAANVFVIDEAGDATTPPLSEGSMPGVVRGLLLEGLEAKERPIEYASLSNAAFVLTNSLRGAVAARWEQAPNRRQIARIRSMQSCYADRLAADLDGALS
jgi:branched-chain amino acid aminotransferase